jgi:hypothetical protein
MHLLLSAERRTPDRVRDYRHPIHHHRQGPIDGHGENSSRHFLLNLRERERDGFWKEFLPTTTARSSSSEKLASGEEPSREAVVMLCDHSVCTVSAESLPLGTIALEQCKNEEIVVFIFVLMEDTVAAAYRWRCLSNLDR